MSYATGSVNGFEATGGFVGDNNGSIDDCYATGNVTGQDRTGGLVGYNQKSIHNSHATGSVDVDGDVEGNPIGGGLVGTQAGESKVSTSYAAGAVNGPGDNIGGLVGVIGEDEQWDSEIIVCYGDEDTTTVVQGVGAGSGDGIFRLSTDDFGSADNFQAWDFGSIWTIGEAPDGQQRPILWWQE